MLGEPIQDFIDAADANGRVTFSTKTRSYIKREAYATRRDFVREHVLRHFYSIQGFVPRFARTKSSFSEAQVEVVPVTGTSDFEISVNLARMLMLPGGHAAAELQEYRAMMMSLRPFFIEHVGHIPCVKILNERDRNRRTYGSVVVMVGRENESSLEKEEGPYQKQLDGRLAGSAVLQEWLKAYALELNRLGPYSWMNIGAAHVFDYHENPEMRRILEEIEAKRSCASAPASN